MHWRSSSSPTFERSKLSQALIDVIAMAFGLFFVCVFGGALRAIVAAFVFGVL